MEYNGKLKVKHCGRMLKRAAGIICAAMFVFGLASCEQSVSEIPAPPKPVVTISRQPVNITVTQGSISGSLDVLAIVKIVTNVTEEWPLSYQWWSTKDENNKNGTPIAFATNRTFNIPTDLTAGTYYYYCNVWTANVYADSPPAVSSNVATVTVNPPDSSAPVITITSHPEPAVTVTGGSITGGLSVVASVTEGAALSYRWYSNTVNSNEGGTLITGAENDSLSFNILTDLGAGTYYYYCVVSAQGAEAKRSNVAVVTVNAPDSVITITTQPAPSTTVTQGSISGSLDIAVSLWEWEDDITYEWYQNTVNSNSGGTSTRQGSHGNVLSCSFPIPTDLTAGTYYYYCLVTAGEDQVYSDVATVTVNPLDTPVTVITITTQPEPTTTVTGGSITGSLSVEATVTEGATLNYQWFENTENSNEGGRIVSYVSSSGYNYTIPTDIGLGTYYYYCVVSAEGAEAKRSNVAVVTVKAPASVIAITTQPASSTIVTQGSISGSLDIAVSLLWAAWAGKVEYIWYRNTENSTSGGSAVMSSSGGNLTSSSFDISTYLTADTYYYYCVITAEGMPSIKSNVAVVTVNPLDTPVPVITITTQPEPTTTVTEGKITGSLSVEATVTEGATPYYQWWLNPSTTIDQGSTSGNLTIPTDLTAGTYSLYCEVTAEGAALVKSNIATLIVKAPDTPVPVITISRQPVNTPVTEGRISASLIVEATVTEGATLYYQWYEWPSGESVSDRSTSGNFPIPEDLTLGWYTYYCEITAQGALSVSSDKVLVEVGKDLPPAFDITIDTQPTATTDVTVGSISGSLNVEASVTNDKIPKYQWYSNETNSNTGGTPVSSVSTNGNFTIPTDLIVGTYYYYCEVTVEGATAKKNSDVAKVTVNPRAPVITIGTQPVAATTVTAGSITGSLSVAASATEGAALNYQWYENETDSNEGGTVINGAAGAGFTIPTNLTVGIYYYYCVVTATGAEEKSSAVAKVTVNEPGDLEVIIVYSENDPGLIEQPASVAAFTDTIFTVSGTGYTDCKWYIEGDPVQAGTDTEYTFNELAGVYTLTVVVTNSAGEKYSGSCHVKVR